MFATRCATKAKYLRAGILGAAVSGALLAAPAAQAVDGVVASAAAANMYLWRGIDLGHPVQSDVRQRHARVDEQVATAAVVGNRRCSGGIEAIQRDQAQSEGIEPGPEALRVPEPAEAAVHGEL